MNRLFIATIAASLFSVLVACNPDPLVLPEPTSSSSWQGSGGSSCDACTGTDGTRIVHRWEIVSTSDGFSHSRFIGYRDVLRNEDCSFLFAKDMKNRCLPDGQPIEQSVFVDPNCTIEVVPVLPHCSDPLPKYATKRLVWMDACIGPGTEIYELGAKYVAPLYTRSNKVCISIPSMPFHDLYELGNEISPLEFVELKVETVP
jgi:hypothetical protein